MPEEDIIQTCGKIRRDFLVGVGLSVPCVLHQVATSQWVDALLCALLGLGMYWGSRLAKRDRDEAVASSVMRT